MRIWTANYGWAENGHVFRGANNVLYFGAFWSDGIYANVPAAWVEIQPENRSITWGLTSIDDE